MRFVLATAVGGLSVTSLILSGCDGSPVAVMDALAKEMQGKGPDEMRALIVGRLGPPTRDIGSGISIEQWDADGGVLTFHPRSGPTFAKGGATRWLIRTTNPAASCLFGGYEMTTPPDPANHGNCFWLGDLALAADGHYRYEDSGSNLEQRAGQDQNYFFRHPEGTARVEYAKGVTAETRLEGLKDGDRVASVTFSGSGESGGETYEVVADVTGRRLTFTGVDRLPFQMYKGWVNFWN